MKQKLKFIVIGCSLALLSSVRPGAAAKLGVACFTFTTFSDILCFEIDDTPSGAGAFTLGGIQTAPAKYSIPVYGVLSFDLVQNKFRLSWNFSFPETPAFDQAGANLDPQTFSGPFASRLGLTATMVFRDFAQGRQAAEVARQVPVDDSLPDMLTILLAHQARN